MPHSLVFTGVAGRLTWGYHLAAMVSTWTIAKAEDGTWTLSGTLEGVDSYSIDKQPLGFVAPNGWRWPVIQRQITDAAISAQLGPKEKNNGTVHQTSSDAAAAHGR